MINIDAVTASRLISALMGVFFGKCCGNATLKITCGRTPMLGITLQHGAQAIEDGRLTPRQRPEAHGHSARVAGACYSLARYDAWGGQMRGAKFSVCLAVRRRCRSLRAV